MLQPVNEWLTLKGELFKGENLDAYLGGIGQGVRVDVPKNIFNEIGSKGGWLAASLGPWDKWTFNLGASMEDVDSADVDVGNRTYNQSVFGNMIYSFNDHTKVGFELSHWRTEYDGSGDAESIRAQSSFIYSF